MKNVEEFVATMVKIDIIEDSNSYGHYPFQLYVELEDGNIEMNALALGGDVASCYKRFAKYKKEKAKRIYLSLDFPKGGDIENDFIAIFSYENGEINLYAIPYLLENGEVLQTIIESVQLSKILEQFKHYV